MYISAQRVRDSAGNEGTNVFVYSHRNVECSGIDWSVPDVGHLAERCPGRLMAAARAVTRPHLGVLAFLDVAAAESLTARAVATLLQSGAARWPGPTTGWPKTWHAGPVGLRFYAVRALRAEDRVEAEFRALKDALLPVLGHIVPGERGEAAFPVRPPTALRVERHRTPVGYRFELSAEHAKLLREASVAPTARSVSVSLENLDAFEIFTGRAIEAEVIQTLTGLLLDQVDALAGAIVVDVTSGDTIWRSPGA